MHLIYRHRRPINLSFQFFILLFFLIPYYGISQQFGGNPPRMRWHQIDTDTARIIFPVKLEHQAQRVSNLIHYITENANRSVGQRHRKINVVLQNQTVVSNGYVGLAPFRSEYFMTSPQSGYFVGSNWLDILTIHEQRHVQQFVNAKRGLTNFGYIISGELGWSFFTSLSIPNWYWEGDAVAFETSLTNQGRGRLPAFYTGFKSLAFDDLYYSYDKVRNGSLKDFVPNHYESGYLMVNYGREKFGNDFWKDVLHDAGKYRSLFYPFSRSLNRKSEYPTFDFYIMTMRYYNKEWEEERNKPEDYQIEMVNEEDKDYTFTTYRYPVPGQEENFIVYKSSFKEIGAFYEINKYGAEYLITRQGRVLDNYFSYKSGKLVWAEVGQDERWSWDVNSNIVIYDMSNYQRKKLTSSTKYFSPDLSSDGKRIIVFHSTPELRYHLHIISSEDGSLIQEIPNRDNYYFAYPKWSKNDEYIIAIARNGLGKNALVKIDPSNGEIQKITEFTNHQIGVPWQTNDHIYFSATFSGVDNIYVTKIGKDSIYQVTDEKIGAYTPSVDESKNELYYTDFTYLGSDIKAKPIDTSNWKLVSIKEPVDMPEYDFISVEAEGGDITENLEQKVYETKKYSNSAKLINLHSWSFFLADPNYEWALRSNNILNTLGMNLGVRYNRNDKNFTYFFDAAYAQLYPVITFNVNYGLRAGLKTVFDDNNEIIDSYKIEWWDSKIKTGLLLPFDISSGLFTRRLNVFSNYAFTSIKFRENENVITTDFNLQSIETGLTFLNRRKKARQNIFSKYSQFIRISNEGSIGANQANQFLFDSEWTFPGLSVNHNIVLQGAFQHEDAQNDYDFADNFIYSRGYNVPIYDYIYKAGVNYHFPLAYPDWGLWGIFYLYRIRANTFFDYSRAHLSNAETNTESIQLYNSVGGELIIDSSLLNYFDMTFGFRYSYLLNDDQVQRDLKHSFEFFIPLLRF
jgi:hypothetical protein